MAWHDMTGSGVGWAGCTRMLSFPSVFPVVGGFYVLEACWAVARCCGGGGQRRSCNIRWGGVGRIGRMEVTGVARGPGGGRGRGFRCPGGWDLRGWDGGMGGMGGGNGGRVDGRAGGGAWSGARWPRPRLLARFNLVGT